MATLTCLARSWIPLPTRSASLSKKSPTEPDELMPKIETNVAAITPPSPIADDFLRTKPLPLPPPPMSPTRWIWFCHYCRVPYPLGCTRRCLNCGHYFCAALPSATTSTTVPKSYGRKQRLKTCRSEFDYGGWAQWGLWRRNGPRDEDGYGDLGVSSRSNDSQRLEKGKRTLFLKREHDCWLHCDFPSECLHTRYEAMKEAEVEEDRESLDSSSASPSTDCAEQVPRLTISVTEQKLLDKLGFIDRGDTSDDINRANEEEAVGIRAEYKASNICEAKALRRSTEIRPIRALAPEVATVAAPGEPVELTRAGTEEQKEWEESAGEAGYQPWRPLTSLEQWILEVPCEPRAISDHGEAVDVSWTDLDGGDDLDKLLELHYSFLRGDWS